jgi:hypothetical protein
MAILWHFFRKYNISFYTHYNTNVYFRLKLTITQQIQLQCLFLKKPITAIENMLYELTSLFNIIYT